VVGREALPALMVLPSESLSQARSSRLCQHLPPRPQAMTEVLGTPRNFVPAVGLYSLEEPTDQLFDHRSAKDQLAAFSIAERLVARLLRYCCWASRSALGVFNTF
jgi:hypothetical protein